MSAADGNHLARDSAAGPRGEDVPRFHAPGGAESDNVPMQELVREIVDLARPQADAAKIRIKVPQEADGVEVRVDRDLLKQAVLNVVVNAMQAMPEGGELRFESSAARTRRKFASPIRAGASLRSCARRSSACISRRRRKARASGWP